MSTHGTDPMGDDYHSYTGEPDLGAGTGPDGPRDAPPGGYVAPGTQPIPSAPPPPPGYAQPPPAYGQPPAPGAYGQPYPTYQTGQPAPGMPYTAYGQPGAYGYPNPGSPYSGPPVSKGAIITLLVLSALLTLSTCIFGVPSLVLSIIALNRASTDGASAKRLSRIGWIVFAILVVLLVAFVVVFFQLVTDTSSVASRTTFGNV